VLGCPPVHGVHDREEDESKEAARHPESVTGDAEAADEDRREGAG